MVKRAENMGDYDKLSPEVVELAYSMNESYNLGQALTKAKSRAIELEKSHDNQLSSSLLALKESGVSGDELLVGYAEATRSSSDVGRLEDFEDMLLLGARLVPGEVALINGEVVIIATPEDDEEVFTPTPRVVEIGRSRGDAFYGLEWAVPVVGKEEMVSIDNQTTVGKVAIKKELDSAYRGDGSRLMLLGIAEAYQAIGDPVEAKRQQGYAVNSALEKLERISSHTGATEPEIADAFEVLTRTGTMDKFLEKITIEIAKDKVGNVSDNAARYGLLHNLIAYRKMKNGECASVWKAKVDFDEVIGLWLVLKARGKALLELQPEQSGQE